MSRQQYLIALQTVSQLLKAIFSHSQFAVNGLILEKDQKNIRKNGKSMTASLSVLPENVSI